MTLARECAGRHMTGTASSISNLLRPKSIAVVGASERQGSFGNGLMKTITSAGYSGCVYPINPKYAEVSGEPCHPDLASLATTPDCALLAVGDESLVPALESAAEAGVSSAVIFGRGYGEHGSGKPRTDAVAAIARDAGMSVCGGNCMGFVNLVDRLQVTGMPFDSLGEAGHVALISHSGSTWSGLVGNQRQLKFNFAISAGQELATSAADYIKFLLAEEGTRVIACVLETVRDPEGFLEALELADARDVPVIVLKLGRSSAGRHFALSHSGAVSGSNAAYDAIFERYNVVSVKTLDELLDAVEILGTIRQPSTPELAIGTDSGGERQLIVDLAADIKLKFASLQPETNNRLSMHLDAGMLPSNPLDYWGDGGDVMAPCLLTLAEDPNVGMVVMATNMAPGRAFMKDCGTAIEAVFNATQKPVALMGNITTTMAQDETARLRALGIPVLMGTETALQGLDHFLTYKFRPRLADRTAPEPASGIVSRWRARLNSSAGSTLPSAVGFELLQEFGIETARWSKVNSVEDVDAFAELNGYPVVLKIDAPDIPHKSDVGGVVTDIYGRDQTRAALDVLRQRHPSVPVIVQTQAKGVQLLLGMSTDEQFGPVITVGLGGIYVEVSRDVVSLIPPFDADEALARLQRLRGYSLLTGVRGQAAADVTLAANQVARFGKMCREVSELVSEIEINPLIIDAHHATAVDCLVVARPRESCIG